MRALVFAVLAVPAAASYGDCSCTCCSITAVSPDCIPFFQGQVRISSCGQCSVNFCALHYPLTCPSSPRGGHTAFKCDGVDDVFVRNAELGGGGLGGLLLLACCVCMCIQWCQRNGQFFKVSHYDGISRSEGGWPEAFGHQQHQQSYVAYGHPVVQPPPVAQYGGYVQPRPVYVHQPPPMPTIVVTDGGHHGYDHHREEHHHHGGHGGHHSGGGGHYEQRSTHTSGGF